MAEVLLHSDSGMNYVCVSDIFINEYMPEADGDKVKVYLYLLSHISDPAFSISGMTGALHIAQKDLCAALKYWHKEGLLRLEYTDPKHLSSIRMLTPVSKCSDSEFLDFDLEDAAEATAEEEPPAKAPKKVPAAKPASHQVDQTIQEILCMAQRYLKKQLTMTETNKILFWYDELGFSPELIEYIIEYSIERGHNGIRYMDTIAMAWAAEGIQSPEAAKAHVDSHSAAVRTVMKAMGISGRNLVPDELEAINRWTDTYGFTLDVIAEACSRTVSKTGKSSFAYAESILKSWNDQGLHHLNEINSAESAHRGKKSKSEGGKKQNTFNDFDQRDYDYDKMEEIALGGQE